MHTIYLDNAATTKPLDVLQSVYSDYSEQMWSNPSALYQPAIEVQQQIQAARQTLVHAFGSPKHKCIFTSSGTEAANTVLLHGARNKKNMNYVIGAAEHACVHSCAQQLVENGKEVRFVAPDQNGKTSADDVAALVDDNTALVSIIHVHNETGAINDIQEIAAKVKAKNKQAVVHSDGVQAFLKEPVLDASNIDYYTVSAHKLHAHKGTGAIFHLPGSPLKPLLLGGGQEAGLRAGTENTLGIVSFAAAVEYLQDRQTKHLAHISKLRQQLLDHLSNVQGMHIVSPDAPHHCPHILSLSFEDVAGETLLHSLEMDGIFIATGSACSSKNGHGRIAKALGLPTNIASGIVRISFSMYNTSKEIHITAQAIKKHISTLRRYMRV